MREQGITSFAARTLATTGLVFVFFEILPHFPVGVSEVHFILGSTLFLLFGAAPAAFGLAFGLLFQGIFFEPPDLPQYGMNVTTLLVPLFGIQAIATRIIAPQHRLCRSEVPPGAGAFDHLSGAASSPGSRSGRSMAPALVRPTSSTSRPSRSPTALVIVIEPLADLGVLALAKSLRGVTAPGLVTPRLHNAA